MEFVGPSGKRRRLMGVGEAAAANGSLAHQLSQRAPEGRDENLDEGADESLERPPGESMRVSPGADKKPTKNGEKGVSSGKAEKAEIFLDQSQVNADLG